MIFGEKVITLKGHDSVKSGFSIAREREQRRRQIMRKVNLAKTLRWQPSQIG